MKNTQDNAGSTLAPVTGYAPEITLRSCPFCGGPARHDRHKPTNYPVVICADETCGAMILGITPREAAGCWNRRANEDKGHIVGDELRAGGKRELES